MGARQRINVAVVNGAMAIAAIAGILAQSVGVFVLVAGVLLLGALYAGDLRLRGGR